MADTVWAMFSTKKTKKTSNRTVSNNAKSLHEDTSVSTTTVWDEEQEGGEEGKKRQHERFKVTQEGTLARSNAADDCFVTSR